VPPAGVIVFGSFARGEADGASDIDVVLVRPADVDDEEDGWGESVEGWRRAVRRASGNRVEVLEVPLEEIAAKLVSEEPLWRDVRHEGVVVLGPSLHELTGDRAG
jgi:predicted nucleotidyltransferase